MKKWKHMPKLEAGKILFVMSVTLLFVLPSFPSVSSEFFSPVKKEPAVYHKSSFMNGGNLLDNIKIQCYGVYPIDIFFSILGLPVYYIRVEISNDNNVTIWMDEHIKLETRDGRILIEFNYNSSLDIVPHSDDTTLWFTRNAWHSYFKYTFGFFDLTIDFTIRGVGEHTKLCFHGLVFGCGSVIFNPNGEKLE